MKILTISNLYPTPEEKQRGLFNAQLFSAMARQGAEIKNICLLPEWKIWRYERIKKWNEVYDEKLATQYSPYFYIPLAGRNISWHGYHSALKNKTELFKDVDMIMATWIYPDCVAATELARTKGLPILLKTHGTDRFHLYNKYRRKLILDAVDYARGIVCNAEFMKKELSSLGIPQEKIFVVPNGVDTEKFRYREKSEALSGLNNVPKNIRQLCTQEDKAAGKIFLFVGHLIKIKGVDLLLDAWNELLKTEKNIKLVIIGDGRMRKELEARVKEMNDSVYFLGERNHNEIALWMNIADYLFLTSRSEGMPNVVLEAMVAGLPVIATDVGDCRRVLNGENATELVVPKNVASIVAGYFSLNERNINRADISAKWRKKLSWDNCAKMHLEYCKL